MEKQEGNFETVTITSHNNDEVFMSSFLCMFPVMGILLLQGIPQTK